jgi:hypothetical protein
MERPKNRKAQGASLTLGLYANFLRKDDGDLKWCSKYPHNTYERLITVIGDVHAEVFEKFQLHHFFRENFEMVLGRKFAIHTL